MNMMYMLSFLRALKDYCLENRCVFELASLINVKFIYIEPFLLKFVVKYTLETIIKHNYKL